ncbi:MAG TPA: DUF4080 domain-containing protein [Candidatus Cloacimonadota bacterium]|nr:DUF4080 domain-containing protein [Candidatus Cloacimonadota bacterium]
MQNNQTQRHIALIAINTSWYQSNLALYYLREMVKGFDFELSMSAFSISDLYMDVLKGIYNTQADVLCFSAYIWNRTYLENILPDVKALMPKAIIIIGGPEAKHLNQYADKVVIGAGEAIFEAMALSSFSNLNLDAAPLHLKDVPFAYHPEDKQVLGGKIIYYETSRGCPFSCAYCLSATDDRDELRFDYRSEQDLSKLYRELDALEALQPRTVKFVDRSFNAHPNYAREMWKMLMSKPRSCEWHFEIYPELMSKTDIELLAAAPTSLMRLETGIQSCDDAINRAVGRNSNWSKAKTMLHLLKERTQVVVHADLLYGLPDQDLQSVFDSIDELSTCFPAEIQLGMLKILPDTPMVEIAQKSGWLWAQNPPYEVLQTDTLSFEDLRLLDSYVRVLNLYWNKGEFPPQWEKLLKKHKASDVIQATIRQHEENGFALHSISKQNRAKVFESVLTSFGLSF